MAQPARKAKPSPQPQPEVEILDADPGEDANVVDIAKGEVVEHGPVTVNWRGIEFTVPPEMPAVAAMDVAEMEVSDSAQPMVRLLITILGPDQWLKARNEVVASGRDNETQQKVMGELFTSVFSAYGMVKEGNS